MLFSFCKRLLTATTTESSELSMIFESAATFLKTFPSIEDIERELQFHQDFIRTINRYRNAELLSVSKLPSDVLSMIFEHLAVSPSATGDSSVSGHYSTWLPATQVCQGWREVALDTPRMWSCIYEHTQSEFVELLLQRSKSAPLHLLSHDPNDYPYHRPTMPLLVHQAERLVEIDLREDSLSNLPFYFDSSSFSNLHTLTLHSSGSWAVIPTIDMLHTLRNIEMLEALTLFYVLLPSETIPDALIAVLPRLMSMSINTSCIDALKILACISCPNVESVLIDCNGYTDAHDSDVLASVASAFYSLIPSPPPTWTTLLQVAQLSCTGIKIRPEHARIPAWPRDSPFEIFVKGPAVLVFHTLCSMLPTEGPLSLQLEPDLDIDCDALQLILRPLDSVREVYCFDVQQIITILSLSRDAHHAASEDEQLSRVSFPSLNVILWKAAEVEFDKHESLNALKQLLGARRAVGAGLKKFKVYSTKDGDDSGATVLSESDVAPLRSCVDDLILF